MMITTTQIRNEFARLSSISWTDYCELCAQEHAEGKTLAASEDDADYDFY